MWHLFPDGGATYAAPDGGWVYVSNSEVPTIGGVGTLRFAADGSIGDAYRILSDTERNCAGGPTPWGSWLSCEEYDFHGADPALAERTGSIAGQVWECDPFAPGQGIARPALGRFQHEAAAVDPDRQQLYLTEDQRDGLFYRFTPTAYPDLSAGRLEAARLEGGTVSWVTVPDPDATDQRITEQFEPGEVTTFNRGEGLWFHRGTAYFTTTGDDRVHAIETATDRYEVIYDATAFDPNPPLRGVDNLVVDEISGDIFVAEDGGDMEVVLITPDGVISPFLQVVDQDHSELTGPAFSPDGTRLYVSSQRGGEQNLGLTYEITGPFRGATGTSAGPSPGSPVGS